MATTQSNTRKSPRKLPDGMVRLHSACYAQFSSRGRRVRKKLSGDFRVVCEMLKKLQLRAYRGDTGIVSNDY